MTAIAITGMHRAGTSMVANALALGGLYIGDKAGLIPPAPDNPRGFFEHSGFVALDEDLLEACGGAWDHPPALLPQAADDPRVAGLRGRAAALVDELAIMVAWGWKDPRTSLTAHFWLDVVGDLRFVVCVRHPVEVAMSLTRRNGTSYAHGLSLWHAYYEALLGAVPPDRRIVTHYDSHFDHVDREMARLLVFAGLPAADIAVVDRDLRNHNVDTPAAAAGIDPRTVELYERLCQEAGREVAAAPAPAPARVVRAAVELVAANDLLRRRGDHIESLQRSTSELAAAVATLQAAGNEDVLRGVAARFDTLEATVDDLLHAGEIDGRPDGAMVRACRNLVRTHVPAAEEVLIVAKDDALLLDLHGRRTANFPQAADGHWPGFAPSHGVAAIANLEALRLRGSRFLLIPETARWWTAHYPELAEHLMTRYEVVADEPGVGLLVDLAGRPARPEGWPRGLAAVLRRLARSAGIEPSVLDWTSLDLGRHLPGGNVFVPPPWWGADELPYLDATIDAVVVDDPARIEEARRVSAHAVVTVAGADDRRPVEVVAVELVATGGTAPTDESVRLVVTSADPDPVWLAALRESVAGEPAVDVAVGLRWPEVAGGADVVAFVEEGVLPLPGCIHAVRTTLARFDRVAAVATKVLAADGALEGAGGMVFSDGTYAGVAAGSPDVVAPWHEYVREVSAGLGLLFVTAAALDKVGDGATRLLALAPEAGTAALWAAGLRVVYQPEAAAVRAVPAPNPRQHGPVTAAAWGPALSTRPARPDVLDEAAWRRLLAGDDVEPVREELK